MAENDATHTVRLWMANSEGDYRHWTARAQALYDATDRDETHEYRVNETRDALADEMKDAMGSVDEMLQPVLNGMLQDLLQGVLDSVDWHDVAEQFVEDIERDEPSGEEA